MLNINDNESPETPNPETIPAEELAPESDTETGLNASEDDSVDEGEVTAD